MKRFHRLLAALFVALWAGVVGCRKEAKTKQVATVAQDTMLIHDLAEANKNTAAAAAADNSLNTVMESSSGTAPALSAETPQNRPAVVPRPGGSGSQVLTSTSRLTVPTAASDAPAPTNVPIDRSPASSPASSDPCDSPAAADQRSCLNRSIVANDADLNHTYQDLIAQARKSGGADLEGRIRQAQRDWVNQRDAACRAETQSTGRLWARAVAKCLADYSDRRTSELRRQLGGLQGQ
jgi:uncharacterized protein YecT (DUF1311 family)